jgi:hypothetical protein
MPTRLFETNVRRPGGVVFVVHGLNTKPEVMDGLVQVLLEGGFHCQRVSLYREEATNRAPGGAIVEGWTRALSSSYEQVQRRFPGLPVNNLSFSIGALLSVHFLEVEPRASFDRMFLLAPPLALTRTADLVRFLTPLRRFGAVLPSAAPRRFRARWATPLSEYAAMLGLSNRLQVLRRRDELSRIPTRIVLDRGDELVSYDGVSDWIERNELRSWRIHELRERRSERRAYKHLIVVEEAIGARAWAQLTSEIVSHFAPSTTTRP